MLIIKCPKADCKGHMVAWNIAGVPMLVPNADHALALLLLLENNSLPVLVPNADHAPTESVKITPEIRKQLEAKRNAEPFHSFMDAVQKERNKK